MTAQAFGAAMKAPWNFAPPAWRRRIDDRKDIVRAFRGHKFSIRLRRVPTKTVGVPGLAFEVEELRFNAAG